MENTKLIAYLRKMSKSIRHEFVDIFFISLFSFIVVIGVTGAVAWYYRADIFSHFAGEYLRQAELGASNPMNQDGAGNQPLLTQQSLVENVVKKTSPAVVSIIISENVPKYVIDPNSQNQQQNPFGNMFPGFPNLLFNTPQYIQNGTQKQDIGGGSGFFVSADGLIVTNKHVVDQTGVDYTVFTNDGKSHPATVVAKDPVLDIALIKIDGSGYPYVNLGNSDALQVGQSVVAIGNALGEFRNTVSVGVVSGLSRSITAGDAASGASENLDNVIQTDAAINPGNSGGPLLDLYGNVIGVNVAVAQGSQSIGFALPINTVKSAIDSVKATGKIIRPYLGIRYMQINSEIQQANNLSVDYGALVTSGQNPNNLAVIPGSPADKAGIVENDIILEVNGTKLDSTHDLASVVRQYKVGDTITLTILHKGAQKTVPLTLAAAPDNLQ
jgi:serine protease Do